MLDRIVVIHDFCNPKGGATLLAVLAAKEFARRGHCVTFLTGDTGDNPALADEGVEIVALGETPARELGSKALLKALYNGAARRWMSAWIRANDTPRTIYYLNNWGQILSPSILGSLNAVRDRLLISAHDFFHVCPNGSYSFLRTGDICSLTPMSIGCISASCDRKNYGYKLWRVARQAIRNTIFDTRAPVPLLVIHERMRSFFIRGGVPDECIVTLPNPVTAFSDERIRAEDNDELIFVGRLEQTKGPDLAAAAARRAGVKARFIGTGVLADGLRETYPEMTFEGFVSRDRIPALLKRGRALIMPSRYPEPYGLVAVEALWSGLPVITTDTAFLAPDIQEAGAGITCNVRDQAALTGAIQRLFSDDRLARAMSMAAYDQTKGLGHSPANWVDTLLTLMESHLAVARGEGASIAAV